MGITFKGSSEYDRNYKWLASHKSASYQPTQPSDPAGISSEQQGYCVEPALQRKKAIDTPAAKATINLDQPNAFVQENDEYMLLGSQEKFVSNVKYPVKKQPVIIQESPQPKTPDAPRPKPSAPPVPKFDTGAPVISKSKQKRQKSLKQESNAAVQTKLDQGTADVEKQATADYAMQYRAGVARRSADVARQRRSEYNKQYDWKTQVKPTPLLAAEQVVYNSNPSLPLSRADPVKRRSEYQRVYSVPEIPEPPPSRAQLEKKERKTKKTAYKGAPKKANESEMTGVIKMSKEEKVKTKPVQNPQRPFFPHRRTNTWVSEYRNNFVEPQRFSYTEGAWKGASQPQLFVPKKKVTRDDLAVADASWFSEVMELRNRAKEYKMRAQGTHFSREHMSQLLARNAALWDAASSQGTTRTSSTIDALGLEEPRAPAGKPTFQPQVAVETREATACTASPNRPKRVTSLTQSIDQTEEINEEQIQSTKKSVEKTVKKSKQKKRKYEVIPVDEQGQASEGTQCPPEVLEETPMVSEATQFPQQTRDEQTQKPSARDLPASVRSDGASACGSQSTVVNTPGTEADINDFNTEPTDVRQESVRSHCSSETPGSAVTPIHPHYPTAPGRVTTPQIRQAGDFIIRHHLDRTTPAVGGTILTAPKPNNRKQKKRAPANIKAATLAQGSLVNGQPQTEAVKRASTTPMYGAPTRDLQPLRDDQSPNDTLLETRYVDTPLKHIQLRQALEHEAQRQVEERGQERAKPEKRAGKTQMSPIEEGYGQTYGVPAESSPPAQTPPQEVVNPMTWPQGYLLPGKRMEPAEDDVLTISNRSVASSCSMASEVLERAHKRREFWTNATRDH